MDDTNKLPQREYRYLVHLFDTDETRNIHDFLQNSELFIYAEYLLIDSVSYLVEFLVHPEAFKRHQDRLRPFERRICDKLSSISHHTYNPTPSRPNLDKFQVLTNTLVPVTTPWEQINLGQEDLLSQLRNSSSEVEFQNIGNSARTLLQKLAAQVFNPDKHKSEKGHPLGEAYFKNRLYAYIENMLGGSSNKELRDYVLSIITTTENSVDLSNKLTHDLKATSLIAETCVIGTITTISLIKLIHQKNNADN